MLGKQTGNDDDDDDDVGTTISLPESFVSPLPPSTFCHRAPPPLDHKKGAAAPLNNTGKRLRLSPLKLLLFETLSMVA